jgi:hypothetical protein
MLDKGSRLVVCRWGGELDGEIPYLFLDGDLFAKKSNGWAAGLLMGSRAQASIGSRSSFDRQQNGISSMKHCNRSTLRATFGRVLVDLLEKVPENFKIARQWLCGTASYEFRREELGVSCVDL